MTNQKNYIQKKNYLIFCKFFLIFIAFSSNLKPINDVAPSESLKDSIALVEQKGFLMVGGADPDQTNKIAESSWVEMNTVLGIPVPNPTTINVVAHYQYKVASGDDPSGKPIMLKINKDGFPTGNGGGLFEMKFNDSMFVDANGISGGILEMDLSVDGYYIYTKINPNSNVINPGVDGLKREVYFKKFGSPDQPIGLGNNVISPSAADKDTIITINTNVGADSGFGIWENANAFSPSNVPYRIILAEKGKFKSVSISTDKIIFAVKENGEIAVYDLTGKELNQEKIPNIVEVNNKYKFKKVCFKGNTNETYSFLALTEDGKILTSTSKRILKNGIVDRNLVDEGLSNIWDASISRNGYIIISMVAQESNGQQKAFGGRTYIKEISPIVPDKIIIERDSNLIDGLRLIKNALKKNQDYIEIVHCNAKIGMIDFRSYPESNVFSSFYNVERGNESGKVMLLKANANNGKIVELITSPENKGLVIGGADVFGADPLTNAYQIDCGNDGSYAWLHSLDGKAFLRTPKEGTVIEILTHLGPSGVNRALRRISISDENTVIGVGFDNYVYRLVDREKKSWQKVTAAGLVRDASVVRQRSGQIILMIVDSNGDVKKMNGFNGAREAVAVEFPNLDNEFERRQKFNKISASTVSNREGLYFAARNDAHRIFEEKDGKLVGPLLATPGNPICYTNEITTSEYRNLAFNIFADGGKSAEFDPASKTPQELINRINEEITWGSGSTFIKGPQQANVLPDQDLKESIKKIESEGFSLIGTADPNQTNKDPEGSWIEMNKLLGIPTPDPTKNITAHYQYKIAIGNGISPESAPLMLKINKDGIPFKTGGALFEITLGQNLAATGWPFIVGETFDIDLGIDGSYVYTKINPNFPPGSDGLRKELFFRKFGSSDAPISIGSNTISHSIPDKNNVICISTNPGNDNGFWIWEGIDGFSSENSAKNVHQILTEKGKFKSVSMSTDKAIFTLKTDGKIFVYDTSGKDLTEQKIPNIANINSQYTFKKLCFKGNTSETYNFIALTEDGKILWADSNDKNLKDLGFSNIFDASISKDGYLLLSMLMQKSNRLQRIWGGRTYIKKLISTRPTVAPKPVTPPTPPTATAQQPETQSATTLVTTPSITLPNPTTPPPPANPLIGNDETAMSTKIAELKKSRFDGKTEAEQITFFVEIKDNISNINNVLGSSNENWKTMYDQYLYLQAFDTRLMQ